MTVWKTCLNGRHQPQIHDGKLLTLRKYDGRSPSVAHRNKIRVWHRKSRAVCQSQGKWFERLGVQRFKDGVLRHAQTILPRTNSCKPKSEKSSMFTRL